MACNGISDGESFRASASKWRSGVGWEQGTRNAGALHLDFSFSMPRTASSNQIQFITHKSTLQSTAHSSSYVPSASTPFMNNMEEILYWIQTKRAPCLLNYDNLSKNDTLSSTTKSKSVLSTAEVPSLRNKKKKKLSLFDDDSVSTEKNQNVYFKTPQNQKQIVISSSKSDTCRSDINFNIKKCSLKAKTKRQKLKNSQTLQKKSKIVTSTPKLTTNLRRSLRQAKLHSINNNSHFNSSLGLLNSSALNGSNIQITDEESAVKRKGTNAVGDGDQSGAIKQSVAAKPKNGVVLNGEFDDVSDVSGFTANYIRSTKIQSKTPRTRYNQNRKLIKNPKPGDVSDGTMVLCVNKAVNTGQIKSNILNFSTDSSQNVINLVTVESNDKPARVSRGTSVLKFINATSKELVTSVKKSRQSKTSLNISSQGSVNASRYPKRRKNVSGESKPETKKNQSNTTLDKKRKISKNLSEFNNSDRKENPEDLSISRTRSGRSIGLTVRKTENSVLVLSNSTGQASSVERMNVASPVRSPRGRLRKKRHTTNCDKSGQTTNWGLLRDKSGFTACFSDSDNESEPLPKKFFCGN